MAPALRTHPPIHLAPNAKILPAIGIKVTSSSSSPQHAKLNANVKIVPGDTHAKSTIVAMEIYDGGKDNDRMMKRRKYKKSFFFRLFKCVRLRKLDNIINDINQNKLVYVDLFYYDLTEKNVTKVIDALVQNVKSGNSIFQDIDVD